jgi:hypothetical protein
LVTPLLYLDRLIVRVGWPLLQASVTFGVWASTAPTTAASKAMLTRAAGAMTLANLRIRIERTSSDE